ncbi:sulfite exporter TauE/SafE family protein [Halobacterium sp. R2-5]|uniref:sulfite exporter TauE/SafE family protein n=1 Tax=Halobacterium sp. R2-5 TaxID=2715751 RepID=UPI001420E721|nr:sulfite exporter TauE/SafE family protein [Halobacterium sp. R2-5]NIB98026.1 sulfite exporter TauE/SafE family protein [Halobacterium sp. R2-5]
MTGTPTAAAAAGGVTPDAGLVAFFVVGLFGGAHCLGMCGPLVTMYGDRVGGDARGPTTHELRQHALFNAGRTASYATVGAAIGAAGSLLVDAGGLLAAGGVVRGVVGVGAGVVILAAGARYATGGGVRASGASIPLVGRAFAAVTDRLHARVDDWATGPGIAALGAIHGLLPCPLLYPAFLYAFATGSPVRGGLALAALGLGTFPSLLAYGTALGAVDAGLRRRLHRGLGVAFLVAGTVPLAQGLRALGYDVPHVPLPMPPLPA